MKNPMQPEFEDDEIRVLRPSEMEFLKGGAQPGPSADPLPYSPKSDVRPSRRDDRPQKR